MMCVQGIIPQHIYQMLNEYLLLFILNQTLNRTTPRTNILPFHLPEADRSIFPLLVGLLVVDVTIKFPSIKPSIKVKTLGTHGTLQVPRGSAQGTTFRPKVLHCLLCLVPIPIPPAQGSTQPT